MENTSVEKLLTLSSKELGTIFEIQSNEEEDFSAGDTQGEESDEEEEGFEEEEDDEDEVRSLQADDVVTSDTSDDEDLLAPDTIRSTNYILRLCVTKQALASLLGNARIYEDSIIIALAQAYVNSVNMAKNARTKRTRDVVKVPEADAPSSRTPAPADELPLPQTLDESFEVLRTQIFRADKLMRGASLEKVSEPHLLLLLAYAIGISSSYGSWDFSVTWKKTLDKDPNAIPSFDKRLKPKAFAAISAQAVEINEQDIERKKNLRAQTLARRAERAERREKIRAIAELRRSQEEERRRSQMEEPTGDAAGDESIGDQEPNKRHFTFEELFGGKQNKTAVLIEEEEEEELAQEELVEEEETELPINHTEEDDSMELVVEGLDEPPSEKQEEMQKEPKQCVSTAVAKPSKKTKDKVKSKLEDDASKKVSKPKRERKQKPKSNKKISMPTFQKKYPDFPQPTGLLFKETEFACTGNVAHDTKAHILTALGQLQGGCELSELLPKLNDIREAYGYPYRVESLEELMPFIESQVAKGRVDLSNNFICVTLW